jgi:hypothetical protein
MMWKITLASLFIYAGASYANSLYHTAAYCYIPAEVLVGDLISMMIQLSVVYLLCYEGPHWA